MSKDLLITIAVPHRLAEPMIAAIDRLRAQHPRAMDAQFLDLIFERGVLAIAGGPIDTTQQEH